MTNWNYADIWGEIARLQPDLPAQAQGDRRFTWAEFDARANGLANALRAAGLARNAKVAQYLPNRPEYLESVFAAFKVAMSPVNTNYRYVEDELVYLWDDADAEAVVVAGSFVERAGAVRARVPGVKLWIWVDDGTAACPDWATPYEDLIAVDQSPARPDEPRTGDDLYLIYTGGTTGMPKGVMWRQDDLWGILNRAAAVRYPEDGGPADIAGILPPPSEPRRSLIPCAPLMHGAAAFAAFTMLSGGGTIVHLSGKGFDPVELLDTVERERVTDIAIVGDVFAQPIVDQLDANPGRWDLQSLVLAISSGVMWSAPVKAAMCEHIPGLLCVDTLGSSEAVGVARSVSSKKKTASTAGFTLSDDSRVITEDGRMVEPGSGEVGMLALRGRSPIGYYKDEAKSARTFPVIDGVRYSVPGDLATVDAGGKIQLLGRQSACINTGGEKVFPEEVEEALKLAPQVFDAVVVGVPDERFGEVVFAVVAPAEGGVIDEAALKVHLKDKLAGYKAPKGYLVVPSVERGPNGKVDHPRWKQAAIEAVAAR